MNIYWRIWSVLVLCCVKVSSEDSSNCASALGLQNGKISNNQLTASTQITGKESYHGRLGDSSAWCSTVQDASQYLQIDLGKEFSISGISTQGLAPNSWVSRYSISTSQDAKTWTKYSSNNKVTVFEGNVEATKTKKNVLPSRITARYVKFLPTVFNNKVCARLEIYGCEVESKDTEEIRIFLIVASVIAGILLICAIVFIVRYVKKRMDQKERQKNARYFPEIYDDIFTAKIGKTPHSLSSYAANDAVGFPRSTASLNVRALNLKLARRQSEMNAQSLTRQKAAEDVEEMQEHSRRVENVAPLDVDFNTSMKDSALEGNVLLKKNPMFEG